MDSLASYDPFGSLRSLRTFLDFSLASFSATTAAFSESITASQELWSVAARQTTDTTAPKPHDFGIASTHQSISPYCNLLHFEGSIGKPPVILVTPNSGHAVDCMHSLVHAFYPNNDVYLVEWLDPRWVPKQAGTFDLDDYTDCLTKTMRLVPGANIIGISQSGTPVMVAGSLLYQSKDPAAPANIVIMGSPINAGVGKNIINWMSEWGHKPTALFQTVSKAFPGAGHLILPGPVQEQLFRLSGEEKPQGGRLQALPATQVMQTIERIFQRHDLADGNYKHRGIKIDPSAITGGIMTVGGTADAICREEQTRAAHMLTPNAARRHHLTLRGARHYDLIKKGYYMDECIAPTVTAFVHNKALPQLAKAAA